MPPPFASAQAGPEPTNEASRSKRRTYKPCSNVNKLRLGTGRKGKSQGVSESSEEIDRMAVGMYLSRHFGAEPLTKRSDQVDATVKPLWANAKRVEKTFHQRGEHAETVAATAVRTVRDQLTKAAPLPEPDAKRRSSGGSTRKSRLSTTTPPQDTEEPPRNRHGSDTSGTCAEGRAIASHGLGRLRRDRCRAPCFLFLGPWQVHAPLRAFCCPPFGTRRKDSRFSGNLPRTQQLPPFRSAALKVLAAERLRRSSSLLKTGSSLSTILSAGSGDDLEERDPVCV